MRGLLVVLAALAVAVMPATATADYEDYEYPTEGVGAESYPTERGGGNASYYFRYGYYDARGQPISDVMKWEFGVDRGKKCNAWKREYVDPFAATLFALEPPAGLPCFKGYRPQ